MEGASSFAAAAAAKSSNADRKQAAITRESGTAE